MAYKRVVELIDDIDGKPADQTVWFALDGVAYEIDLSAKNADELRGHLAPYAAKARKAGRTGRSTGPRTPNSRERSAEIRAWAKQHEIIVNDRGRIPVHVVEAYETRDPSHVKTLTKAPQATFQAPG